MRRRRVLLSAANAILASGCGLLFFTPYKVTHMSPEQLRDAPNAHLCAGAGRSMSRTIEAEIERRGLLSDSDREHIELERVAVGMSRCALEIVMGRRRWVLHKSTTTSSGFTDLVWLKEMSRYREFHTRVDENDRLVEWVE